MSILTNFFIARPAHIESLDADLATHHLPQVHAKQIDPVKIATLDGILTGELHHIPDPVRETDDGNVSIVPIRQALTHRLADISDEQLARVAEVWAATEEWQLDGGMADELALWLNEVRALAQRARAADVPLYVWMCL